MSKTNDKNIETVREFLRDALRVLDLPELAQNEWAGLRDVCRSLEKRGITPAK